MKKTILFAVMLLLILGAAGCSKEEKFIDADKVSVNTILAKSNGELQVATVENFDKTYYNLNELEEFIAKEIDTYNQKSGEKKIKIDKVLQRQGKAIMLLTYPGMEQYATFNKATAAYFNSGIGNVSLTLPSTLISAKNDSLVSTQNVLSNDGLKILVMNEPYEIVVDGKVKYYSNGAKLVDNDRVQGAAEGMTIVVFK